ncbi:MAG: hypothetical protein M3525_09005 [Acidobacteriota bacterium]|nr:hypothetical protein [Acidobacteriota bacterium]
MSGERKISGEIRKENLVMSGFYKAGFALLLSFWLTAGAAFGQTTGGAQTAAMPSAGEKSAAIVVMPVLTNYREIQIGTTADQVRDKLGKAKIDNKNGFYYQFSDEEFAQIRVDKDKKVRFLAVTYADKNDNAPKFEDVFGKEIAVEAKPNGSIYHLVSYPQAGYWVAYSRTAGKNPTVTVTMQKMPVKK